MIASPGSSTAATSSTVFSRLSPAGPPPPQPPAPPAPPPRQRQTRPGVDVVDDAVVPVAHQAASHIGAHATEADESELHRPYPTPARRRPAAWPTPGHRVAWRR